MNGLILDLEHFAIHDGPGIRLVVFLKGCPLRCLWCHTPESQSGKAELLFQKEHCLQCGSCRNVWQKIPQSDWSLEDIKLSENCPVQALQTAGKVMSAKDVMQEVLKEKMFFEESGGGLTISGGEPLFQGEFTGELLKLAAENEISSCVETCGFGNYDLLREWLPLTEIFLYDFKASDPDDHRRLTGVDDLLIRKNLEQLSRDGARIFLRCPLIPGVNDSPEHLLAIAQTAENLSGIEEVHIIPYHPMARGKYEQLGRTCPGLSEDFPAQDIVKHYAETVARYTNKPVIVP